MDIDTLLEQLNGRLARFDGIIPSVRQEMARQEQLVAHSLATLTEEAQAASKQLHAERVRLVAALDRQLARIAGLGGHAAAAMAASAEAAHAHAGAARQGCETMLAEAGALRQHVDTLARSGQALVDATVGRCSQQERDVAAMLDALAAAQAAEVDEGAQILRTETAAAARQVHEGVDALATHVRQELDGLDAAVKSGLHGAASHASRQLEHDLPERMTSHHDAIGDQFQVADAWMKGFGAEFGVIDKDLHGRLEDIARLIRTIQPVLDQVKHIV
jgi:hypothetical protein